MIRSPRIPGLLVPVILSGMLCAADARGELLKIPPVHKATPHAALIPNRPQPRIAFIQVNQNPTTRSVVDLAIATLTRKGFEVLEREHIEKVLKEQKFHGGELVDLDQQVQLGKIMGVTDLVMVDASTIPGGSCKLSTKAVDITSAKVLRVVKDTYADQKNAGRALAGFYTDWNEVYDLRFGPCPALESGDYESLAATYQMVLDACLNPTKIDALAQIVGSRSSGGRHSYKGNGSTIYSIKAWSSEPEDSPKRGAFLVYESYIELQLGLLFLQQDKLDAALAHLEQAELKMDKSYGGDESDQQARDIKAAKCVAQRLKTEKEIAEE